MTDGRDEPVLYPIGEAAPPHRLRRATSRLAQVPSILRRAIRHPAWVLEAARMAGRRRRSSAMPFSVADHRSLLIDEAAALEAITGAPPERCRAALAVTSPLDGLDLGGHPLYGARPQLLRLVAAVVSLTHPAVVVETGVAQGLTSATILEALEQNGRGRLHSIDLPVLAADSTDFVGRLVPDRLRHRWTLHLGPSSRLLGPLLEELGRIDLFLHDAEHTYAAQLEELQTVWPHLDLGGVVLVDDVNNPAFIDFATAVGATPHLVADADGPDALGLLRRS